jgi:diadenosine tetraphosphate (Ap4A) HIT family hydrolase
MSDWRDDRIGSAHRGANPMVMTRMRSGFAVIGDTQHLPGYSLLLSDDLAANDLTDLDWRRRADFMFDLSLLGEAVELACAAHDLRRVNHEVLGNSMARLHGHVHARYTWEPPTRVGWPVWCYPAAERDASEHAYNDAAHGELRAAITGQRQRLMTAAY